MKTASPLIAGMALSMALLGCSRPSDADFGKRVQAYLMAHPEVVEAALQKSQDQKTAAADAAARDAIRSRRAALEHDPRDFVANPNGKVTVVEFFDYRCPYCKAALPDLMSLVNQDKDVRFVFKEFPILDNEGTPGVSKRAALAAMASQRSGKYLQMHNALMGQRALDDAAIVQALQANGIDPKVALQDTPQADKRLADDINLATAIGVTGTPTFEINGKLVSGADMAALGAAIAEAKKAKS